MRVLIEIIPNDIFATFMSKCYYRGIAYIGRLQ